jgi:hypothetical protein
VELLCSTTSSSCEANPGRRGGCSGTLSLSFPEPDSSKYAGLMQMPVPLLVRHQSVCRVHVTEEHRRQSARRLPLILSPSSSLSLCATSRLCSMEIFIVLSRPFKFPDEPSLPALNFLPQPHIRTPNDHASRPPGCSWAETQTLGVCYPTSTPPNLSPFFKAVSSRRR